MRTPGRVLVALLLLAIGGCSRDGSLPVCNDPSCAPTDGGASTVETLVLRLDGNASATFDVSCTAPGPSKEQLQVRAFCQKVGTSEEREVTRSPNLHWAAGNSFFLVVNDQDNKGRVQGRCPLPHGGQQWVTAQGECGRAALAITLKYHAPDILADNAPVGSPDGCPGPIGDPGDAPVIVYPLDGAMHAANLWQITLQWSAPLSHLLFRVHAVGATIDASAYVGATGVCHPDLKDPKGLTNLCRWTPPASWWRTIGDSVRGDKALLTITGCAGGGGVAESAPVTVFFAPEPVRGSLYYFTPSSSSIKRLPFGAPTATNFLKGGVNSELRCAGCHALSLDGKKMAATAFSSDGLGVIVDTSSGKYLKGPMQAPVDSWNFATFSPDGTELLTNWKGTFTLRDGTTGARKFDVDPKLTGGRAILPEWSPDGTQVAFVQLPPEGKLGSDFPVANAPKAGDWIAANTGNLAVMRYERGAFQPARVVLPATKGVEYHYYPSWSPDSKFLLFVSATAPGDSPAAWEALYGPNPMVPAEYRDYVMTYNQHKSRLRVIQVDGAGSGVAEVPIDLPAAGHVANSAAAWPRFSPFQQGNLAFLTFSSRIDYGFVVTGGTTPQLWMAAVDLGRAATDPKAGDPSYPPVWLPFQDTRERNYAGTWTRELSCVSNDDCGPGFLCKGGVCSDP